MEDDRRSPHAHDIGRRVALRPLDQQTPRDNQRASRESAGMPDSQPPSCGMPLRRIPPSVEDSGTVNGQFERSGDLRWNRAVRNCPVLLAPRESWVGTRPALVAAEAEIASTHAGERINFSRARVSATYMM